jgi:hypothetical protein
MSSATPLLVVGGVALVAGGAYLYTKAKPKAEATVPGAPPMVPVHPGVTGQPEAGTDRTSLCQVLTGYRSQLRRFQDLMADAQKKMRDLEGLIEGACRTYALEPVYTYRCNGIPPFCGINEWMEVTGVQTDQSAFNACIAYAKTGAALAGRQVEKRDGIYRSTWQDVDRINAKIAQGYAQVQDLRKQYEAAQRQYEEARAQAMELERRMADLESQGVFC